MKKANLILIAILFLLIPTTVLAYTVNTSPAFIVSADETIEDNVYAGSQTITVDGKIDGDLICFSQTLNINGEITGDVICGATTININGKVNGNIRVVGENISLNGQVGHNAITFGKNINLEEQAQINGDLLIAAQNGDIRGQINQDLHGAASNIVIAGTINGNTKLRLDERVNASAKPLIVEKRAIVNGDLSYSAGTAGLIAEGAQIQGKLDYNKPEKTKGLDWGTVAAWLNLFSIFSALVIGLVLISLWGEQIKKLNKSLKKNIPATLGWGLVIMFLTPIVCVLLIFTIIGMPLALITFALWMILTYVSKIVAGIALGEIISEKLWPKKKISLMWVMILGIIVTWILYALPFFGWFISLLAIWWGLGGMFLYYKENK